MIKNFLVFFIFVVLLIIFTPFAYAHCPLCTAAVGAAAISAKYYGMDISIIGLLIGAFGVSTGLWIGLKINKRYFKFQLPIIILVSFLFTVIPLLYINNDNIYFPILFFGQAGSLLNKVYWINKLLFGSVVGGLVSLVGYYLHIYIKKVNGKVLFPFQGFIITLAFLAVSSLGLYFTIGA